MGVDFLDFKNFIAKAKPELMIDGDEVIISRAIKELSQKYKVLTHTF